MAVASRRTVVVIGINSKIVAKTIAGYVYARQGLAYTDGLSALRFSRPPPWFARADGHWTGRKG